MKNPIAFAGNPLDRASALRADDAWIAARHREGRFLPFWKLQPLLTQDAKAAFLPWRADWEGRTVTLLPANSRLQPMTFDAGQVTVFGRVVTVLRRL